MLQFPARALKIPPTVFCLSCWKRLWNRRRSCTGCPSPHTNVLDTDAPEQNKQTKPLSFWVTCLLSKATGHKCSPLPVLRDGKLRVSSAESILPLKYEYYEYQRGWTCSSQQLFTISNHSWGKKPWPADNEFHHKHFFLLVVAPGPPRGAFWMSI